MDFSESKLVELCLDSESDIKRRFLPLEKRHCIPWCRRQGTRRRHYQWHWTREFNLASGRRIDVLFHTANYRIAHIVEFKVFADHRALAQVLQYSEEFRSDQMDRFGKLTLATCAIFAQHFTEDVLELARFAKVQCVQIAPFTKTKCTLTELVGLVAIPRDLLISDQGPGLEVEELI